MNRCILSLLSILILVYSCSGKSGEQEEDAATVNIIPGQKDSAYIAFADHSISTCDIKYINEYGDPVRMELKGSRYYAFPLKRFNMVQISHDQETVQVPCYPGDTAYINFKENWKWKYRNRIVKEYDTTFLKYSRLINQSVFDSLDRYRSLIRAADARAQKNAFKEQLFLDLSRLSRMLLDTQLAQLAHLQDSKHLSLEYYLIYTSLAASNHLNDLIWSYNETRSAYILSQLLTSPYLHDKYLIYDIGSYKSMIGNYLWSIVARNIGKKQFAGTFYPDCPVLYDSLSHYLSGNLLQFARYRCLVKMHTLEPYDTTLHYIDRFKEEINDSQFRNYVMNRFAQEEIKLSIGILY